MGSNLSVPDRGSKHNQNTSQMESTLLNGRYTADEAEQLLCKLFQVKMDFHASKIDTINLPEEDIKHTEKRLRQLEHELRGMIHLMKKGSYKHVALHAKLSIEFCPDYFAK